MKKYQDKDIDKALKLRKQHKYSFAKLQLMTGIPATTIRNWCKNDFIGTRWDTLLLSNERNREKIKLSETKSIDSINEIDSNIAKIFSSLLYWCEGAKYPSSNAVGFANSDPNLSMIFIKFLRAAFPIDESKFRVRLQIHDIQNFEEIRKYWSNILEIPESQFSKPTITTVKGGKHNKNYLGTCTIKYADYKIQLKLIGIYEAFFKKFEKSIKTYEIIKT